MRLKPRLYASPIALPEAQVGRFAIKHHTFEPKNGPVALVGFREALLTGQRPVAIPLTKPMTVHQLVEFRAGNVEGVWMSDEPQELRQAAEWLRSTKPRGRVLVGGLGLGVIASWLTRWQGVEHVEVVELEQDVIDLVAHQQGGYTVRHDDLFHFLRTCSSWLWDYAFLDTWQGTSEHTWWTTVMPLRRIIANRFGRQRVHCWAEDMMLGQVQRALFMGNRSTRSRLLDGLAQGEAYGGRGWYYEGLPDEMTDEDIEDFVSNVGLPAWEKRWGSCLRKEDGCRDGDVA